MSNIAKKRMKNSVIKKATQSESAVDNRVYRICISDPRVEHAYCIKYLRALLHSLPVVVQYSKNPQPDKDGNCIPKPKNITHNRLMDGISKFETFLKRPRYWGDEVRQEYINQRNTDNEELDTENQEQFVATA